MNETERDAIEDAERLADYDDRVFPRMQRELDEAEARARAAEERVEETVGLLAKMVDWHERGDMDSNEYAYSHFVDDLNRARASLTTEDKEGER